MHPYDITIVTDSRYIAPKETNIYINNVLQEDGLVGDALRKLGLKVTRKAWDDPVFDWNTTQYAIFRSTWDYFDRYDEFSAWLASTSKQTQFINSKKLLDWNMDKHYLLDLARRTINVPKTFYIEKGEKITLQEAIAKAIGTFHLNTEYYILKPCISGAARHTYKIHKSEIALYKTVFEERIANEAMMLQEFQRHIVTQGEISMMLFNGVFTHAVLKRAKPGDFRVQDDFGGKVQPYPATQEEIEFSKRVVAAAPELPLYARVDIFRDNQGELALAELEIFEPELWFRFSQKAATLLAKSIQKKFFL